jgi:hypothetical protein
MACKCKTEVYSRVVGYYRPVQQWNKGKQAEYLDRVTFKVTGKIFADGVPLGGEQVVQQAARTA